MAFLSPDCPPVCRNPPCNTPRHLKSNWTAQRRRSGARPIPTVLEALALARGEALDRVLI
eukprot:scaffold14645_cov98-Isochrysis_galbana.AAC.2